MLSIVHMFLTQTSPLAKFSLRIVLDEFPYVFPLVFGLVVYQLSICHLSFTVIMDHKRGRLKYCSQVVPLRVGFARILLKRQWPYQP